jgi:GcrA cell cycle regulator
MQAQWPPEDVALLKKLWTEGSSATEIAARLGGISRSAVLGKVFRLRLPPAPAGKIPPADKTAPTPAVSKQAPARRRRGAAAAPAPKRKRGGVPKSLFELTNSCCRWPFRRPGTQKYFFCGVEEADLERGIPYCRCHMRRAYLVPPRLVEKSPRQPFRA